MRKIVRRPQAVRDLADMAVYLALAEPDDLKLAERFLTAAESTLQKIAEMPGIGVQRDFNLPEFRGMRMVSVSGFRHYLVYYLYTDDVVDIVRVYHASRDISGIFPETRP